MSTVWKRSHGFVKEDERFYLCCGESVPVKACSVTADTAGSRRYRHRLERRKEGTMPPSITTTTLLMGYLLAFYDDLCSYRGGER